MKYLKIAALWAAVVLCPQLITLKVATWAFSSESHDTYRRIERLIADYDTRQQHRMTNIKNIESRFYASEGRILEEVDKRIATAIQRHELIKHTED